MGLATIVLAIMVLATMGGVIMEHTTTIAGPMQIPITIVVPMPQMPSPPAHILG